MLKTLEIIKEQIKVLKNDQRTAKNSESKEVTELRELVEFIDCDTEILLEENRRLKKQVQSGVMNKRLNALKEALAKEKMKGLLLTEKIDEMERTVSAKFSQSFCNGNLTERDSRALNNSISARKSPVKLGKNVSKSPIKPPRYGERSFKMVNDNSKLQMKSKLDKAIDQAYKTLASGSAGLNRSISPCFSTSSSRYSTPGKKAGNTSLSNN